MERKNIARRQNASSTHRNAYTPGKFVIVLPCHQQGRPDSIKEYAGFKVLKLHEKKGRKMCRVHICTFHDKN